jgi:hypothetical protein
MEARRTAAALFIVSAILIAPNAVAQAQTAPTDTPTPSVVAAAPSDTPTLTPAATPTSTPSAAPIVSPTPFVSGVPCANDDPSNERVQRSERHGEDTPGDQSQGRADEFRTGNGKNEVYVHNCTDNRLRVRAAIQLNTIRGKTVDPLNVAYAESTCNEPCQTLAVALQIDLYSRDRATDVQPENYAVAINNRCNGCRTVAHAAQYVQGVDDPREVSSDLSDRVEALSNELTAIQSDPTVTLPEAESRLNAVIARFNELGGTLREQRDERSD